MKILSALLLGCALLATEAAVAASRPKLAKRAAIHTKNARRLNPNMHFRRSPRPAPMLDLHAHSPEKFKTVRASGNYKFK
jgi:hypothetical protein